MSGWRKFLSSGPEGRLERKLALAWLALSWERLWRALLWPLMVAGLFALLVVTGLLPALPGWPRLFVLWALAVAFVLSLRGVWRLRPPARAEAMARVERASGLAHQPLRTLADTVAAPEEDAVARTLWRAHARRLKERLRALRVGAPRSDAPRRDPYALRFALALALVAAFALQGERFGQRLGETLRLPSLGGLMGTAQIDAWIDPPPYVRQPPLALATAGKVLHADDVVQVHQESRLVVRLAGAENAPTVRVFAFDPATRGMGERLPPPEVVAVEKDAWRMTMKLRRPVVVRISGGGASAEWRLDVKADMPPAISFVRPPAGMASGALRVAWQASDDHGLKAARVEIALAEPVKGMLSFEPPKALLRGVRGRQAKGRDLLKLAGHPWAGLPVRITLVATDVAGQEGRSRSLRMILPERKFGKPLAQAIIEQRRALVLHPERAEEVAEMLAAFLAWPVELLESSGAYLGLRQAAFMLHRADGDRERLKSVVALLWRIAEDIEDGTLADLRRQVEAAQRALREALRNGASEEEIARRMAELKQALNRYLSELAQQQMQQGRPRMAQNGQARMIRPQDLQRMLEQMEKLARSGSRQAAERLLSQLDSILQNLQTAPMAGMQTGPEQQAMRDMQKLMREQQRLMNDTFRKGQEMRRQGRGLSRMPEAQGEGGGNPGEQRGDGEMQGLEQRQRGLADALREMMRKLGPGGQAQGRQARPDGSGDDPARALSEAERAMRGAARALGKGQAERALRQQMQALQALRKGVRQMARRMQGQGGMGMAGMRPQYDPLGRPRRGQFMDPGPGNPLVPDENAMERARRILEYLRRRAEDRTRPPVERNYFDRLLRGLY